MLGFGIKYLVVGDILIDCLGITTSPIISLKKSSDKYRWINV